MLHSILHALTGRLEPGHTDTAGGRTESGARIEWLRPARDGSSEAAAPRLRHLLALFSPASSQRPPSPGTAPLHVALRTADLRGKAVEFDLLWTSFQDHQLDDSTRLRLSPAALHRIAAQADRELPLPLCMALHSIATLDTRHARARIALLDQIVGALAAIPGKLSPQVVALLRAYHAQTGLFAGVTGIDALLQPGSKPA